MPASGALKVAYIQPDHLGTPRVVIDTVRNLSIWEWSSKSEVSGNQAPNGDPDGDGVVFELALRFPGQQATDASGLFYNYQQEYDPAVGRYSQNDPIGLAGGISTYAYVDGKPLTLVDQYGLEGCYVSWPGYPITVPGTSKQLPLIHAGALSYDASGKTRYYEYGRYENDQGNVRRRPVPDLKMGPDGKPTAESRDRLKRHWTALGKAKRQS